MCGICGFFGQFSDGQLRAMTDALAHRGPDGEGVYRDGPLGLGHRRLSIVDLEGGAQPLSNEDDSVWVSFNGEIYNHVELRERFLGGHRFRTRCDTEVLVHLYEELGDSFVTHLRGMFAFALWDSRRGRLLLVRDRFGIKPLYFTHTPRGLAFASEVKALIAAGAVTPEVNREALPSFLEFRYVAGPSTLFKGVERLEPGHMLILEGGRARTECYWRLGFGGEPPGSGSVDNCASAIREGLSEAIRIRLMADVPLGAFLSGGLDSSFLVGLMSQQVNQPVNTFTAGLDGEWHDERGFAQIAATAFGTNHHVLPVHAAASETLPRVTWYLDEPLADAAVIPTFLLSELTSAHVKVVLTGEGADELLGGYDKYRVLLYGGRLRRLGALRAGARLLRGSVTEIGLRRALDSLSKSDSAAAYRALVSVFDEHDLAGLVAPGLAREPAWERERARVGELMASCPSDDPVDQLAFVDLATWLPNDVLLKVDKMSMAHGLEARVPFLDHLFARLLTSIPSGMKIRRFKEKWILRAAARGVVPEPILKRRKHGFTVPVSSWLEGELAPMVDRALSAERVRELGYWNPAWIETLRRQDMRKPHRRRQLWTLLTFDVWHRVFIEGQRPVEPMAAEVSSTSS